VDLMIRERETAMIIERTKPLYAKFINQTEISYVPVYLWKTVEDKIIGCVPEFPPGAEVLPINHDYIKETYGDFESYLDESQMLKEIADTGDN